MLLPVPVQLRIANVVTALALGTIVVAGFAFIARHPYFAIKQVRIVGKLSEVNAEHLSNVAKTELRGTFFTLNLGETQAKFKRVPWVRAVKVRRLWPRAIEVHIEEHVPLAYWNQKGMVNTKGEFFDAEYDRSLPLFIGPKGREREMTERYQATNERLLEKQWSLQELRLTERDSWRLKLSNQWQVEMGREAYDERFTRFMRLATRVVSDQGGRSNSFDMRYQNGFAVAYVPVADTSLASASGVQQGAQYGY